MILTLLAGAENAAAQWNYYHSPNTVKDVAVADGSAWCVTTTGIVRWDIATMTPESHTIVRGDFGSFNTSVIGARNDKTIAQVNGRLVQFNGYTFTDHPVAALLYDYGYLRDILIDSDGTEWYAASHGLTRYDGTESRTYEITGISSVINGPGQGKWIVSVFSGSYRPSADSSSELPQDNILKPAGELPYGAVISFFDGEELEEVRRYEAITGGYTIVMAADGSGGFFLWVKSFNYIGELYHYEGTVWKEFAVAEPPQSQVSSMEYDPDSRRLAMATDNGITAYTMEQPLSGQAHAEYLVSGLDGYAVNACAFGGGNTIYAGTDSGLYRYDGTQWTLHEIGPVVGNNVTAHLVEKKGTVWFGTTTGVSRIRYGRITTWTDAGTGIGDYILNMLMDSANRVWIVTEEGIARFDDPGWTAFPFANATNTGFVKFDSNGVMWLVRSNGVYTFDTSGTGALTVRFSGEIADADMAPDGTMWALQNNHDPSKNVLYRFDGYDPVMVPSAGIRISNVTVAPDGDAWILDGAYMKAHRYRNGEWTTYTQEDGVPFDSSQIYFNKGDIWLLSSREGVSKMAGDTFQYYPRSTGVPYELNGLLFQKNGIVWAFSRNGLSRFDGDVWQREDGPFGDPEISITRAELDSEDQPWFATNSNSLMIWSHDSWKTVTNGVPGSCSGLFFDMEGYFWYQSMYHGVARYSGDPVFVEDVTVPAAGTITFNSPNPFNPVTTIHYTIRSSSRTVISVYNIAGQQVQSHDFGMLPAGPNRFVFDGSGLSTGVYIYRIVTSRRSQTGRMLLLK